MRNSTVAGLFIVFALAAGSARGQSSASAGGTVTDPSGTFVPGAQIILTEIEARLTRAMTSNASGLYVISSLRPTAYSLMILSLGFKDLAQTGITLLANDKATINVKLEIGSAGDQVTVEAYAAQFDTTSSTLRQVVDLARIVELPLNDRNVARLTTLVAGSAAGPSNAAEGIMKTFPVAVTASVNGRRTNQTSYLLDGVPNNELLSNVKLPFPMPDRCMSTSLRHLEA